MKVLRFAATGLAALVALAPALAVAAPLPALSVPGIGTVPLGIAASVSVDPAVGVAADSYVPAGQVHEGDLVSVMGHVRIEGEVTGSVVVVFGELEVSGHVGEDVVSVLSRSHLAETAKVDGQFVNVGWTPMRDHGSSVAGEVININFMNLVPFAGHGGGLRGLLRFLLILHLMKLTFLFVVLLVITSLMPRRLEAMAAAFPARWGWAFLVGLLTYAGVLIGAIFLAITIIGIPLALLLWFVAKLLKWVGLAAIFYLMGQSMGRNMFKRDLPHIASVLAGFVLYAVVSVVPLLGWMFGTFLSILALGLALVTRFGSEPAAGPAPAMVAAGPGGPPPGAAPGMTPSSAPGTAPPPVPAAGEPPRAW
jgi:hypothetical protein